LESRFYLPLPLPDFFILFFSVLAAGWLFICLIYKPASKRRPQKKKIYIKNTRKKTRLNKCRPASFLSSYFLLAARIFVFCLVFAERNE